MTTPPICDYEGSDYRTAFWEGRGRDYEDTVERIALRRLLPAQGRRVLEIGAGFGRLTDELKMYDQIVLMDYSRSQLEHARDQFGLDGRFTYIAANVYRLPFAPGAFDGATCIRVLHHLSEPELALKQIAGVLARGAAFILEFANKRNVKAIARWLLRRQDWNPFARGEVEFYPMHFDFHPADVREMLSARGFRVARTLTVSHFRIGALKRHVPLSVLARLDSWAQLTGGLWQLSPSVIVRADAKSPAFAPPNRESGIESILRCPTCAGELKREAGSMVCGSGHAWPVRNGIYDFKGDSDAA